MGSYLKNNLNDDCFFDCKKIPATCICSSCCFWEKTAFMKKNHCCVFGKLTKNEKCQTVIISSLENKQKYNANNSQTYVMGFS